MKENELLKHIDSASRVVGTTWPLYSFVTSNPLAGYEGEKFLDAIEKASEKRGAKVLPGADVFEDAFHNGEIGPEILRKLLRESGKTGTPEDYLEQLKSQKNQRKPNPNHELDRICIKWLSAFMDEGLADWEMPFKKKGFYKSWRKLAIYDGATNKNNFKSFPKTSQAAIEEVIGDFDEAEQFQILENHLAALPGWTGYIKYRLESNSIWQQKYPIDLIDYLAVRLWTAKLLKLPVLPEASLEKDPLLEVKYLWLRAWEKTYQQKFLNKLKQSTENQKSSENTSRPDAQFVFCIDTRSELVRRHLEFTGNYETFGYAGFFGIPMDYENPDDGLVNKSCPPIVPSNYRVSETPSASQEKKTKHYQERNGRLRFYHYFLKRMKNLLPSAFGFVEGSGFFYGFSLLVRTLRPAEAEGLKLQNHTVYENIYEPEIQHNKEEKTENPAIPLEEKTALVKSAFDLCGWRDFARIVLFTGHESHTANNPFASSLDCGACAGNSGKNNARMLAKLANDPDVRRALKEGHEVEIPSETIFIGACHNTTTDEIQLFDRAVPPAYQKELNKIKSDLKSVKKWATQERLSQESRSVSTANAKANNWAETRPEWGLAKNAAYVIGPRHLSKKGKFKDAFFSSYDWKIDPEGAILEGLMQGPMVVTQWINNHYYFAAVDNESFGGGTKITHNIVGKFGVVQGNGGDLKTGLPLQSLKASDRKNYHSPLRLSVVVQAPKNRVLKLLEKNPNLKTLLDNEWIHLFIMDPENGNEVEDYEG